jgi:hypothetical protein
MTSLLAHDASGAKPTDRPSLKLMRGRALVLCMIAFLGVGTFAHPANAEPKPATAAKPLAQALAGAAKADYDSGKLLAADGDFAGALIKFESAYEQSKDPRLLWNVAFCEKNLRHYAKVIATLGHYLDDGAGYLTDKDRKDARDLVQTLQPFTTSATIHVSEDGAQIAIDDNAVGVSPLAAPVVLDIGERHLRVTKEGFQPFEKTVPVGGSAAVTVDVALEKEVHQGRLIVNAPPNATLELDEAPMGTGKIDLNLTAGGHQLRVTAPGMRPFQSEVVIQDRETRSVDVTLEKLAEPERPKIRVAIGCDGPEPQGPDDGLVVYLDGPDVLPPANVKKKWSDDLGRNVVEYVEYTVTPGPHALRARIPECVSLETQVTVDPVQGADVVGALRSDTPLLLSGPQGVPGHWRLGLDMWMFLPVVGRDGVFQARDMPDAYKSGAAPGAAIEGALLTRWFRASLSGGWASGSAQRTSFDSNFALPATPDVKAVEGLLRVAFRAPFNVVALNVGSEAGLLEFEVKDVYTKYQGVFGLWTGLDVQPLCDWGARASFDLAFASEMSSGGPQGGGPVGGANFGVFWEPNARCRRERSTDFGLRAGGR